MIFCTGVSLSEKNPTFSASTHTMRSTQNNHSVPDSTWQEWNEEARELFNRIYSQSNKYKVKMIHSGCDVTQPKMSNAIRELVKAIATDAADVVNKSTRHESKAL